MVEKLVERKEREVSAIKGNHYSGEPVQHVSDDELLRSMNIKVKHGD